jgi:hypothetical protein
VAVPANPLNIFDYDFAHTCFGIDINGSFGICGGLTFYSDFSQCGGTALLNTIAVRNQYPQFTAGAFCVNDAAFTYILDTG